MKHLSKFLVVILLVVGVNNIQAQDENNPWQVSFGVNAIDTYPTGDDGGFGSQLSMQPTIGIFFLPSLTLVYQSTLVAVSP